ncbi:LacI family DNA-binding transcriptional regulator [Oryzibacter oryziterrae]|uniref:LacI family DNA-binding transcriptional regulator n=1 Tax=Oryzibacter oryziterrae TaxID=2766474 RepID=UPI001F2B1718|nr:LacI family DNA-binding transcriptional regulator [Oryzibacter oryziterrae]
MVTIKEIAKAVGVSSATVSRVLNYDTSLSITEVKRQAIIETAEALNYLTPRNRPRAGRPVGADAASNGRIAIVHFLRAEDEMADPYYIGVRLGIEARARANRVEVVTFYNSGALPTVDDPSVLSGIIALGLHTDAEIDWVRQMTPNLIFADFAPYVDDLDIVACDLRFAMTRLLDQLHAVGYRRFAFLGDDRPSGNVRYPSNEERAITFKQWTQQHELFDPAFYLLADRLCFENGYQLARSLLEAPTLPEIIVTSNDNMAIGAYRAIQEKGLSIPRDIAIASFNDIPSAQFLAPPLTTVRIPAERIGENAFDLLAERMAGRDYAKKLIIATEIIWRDSTRAPGGTG